MLGPALPTAPNIANILVSLPHLVTGDLTVFPILIRASDLHRTSEPRVVCPAVPGQSERLCIGRVDRLAAVHLVDCLVAPLDVGGTAERLALAVVWRRHGAEGPGTRLAVVPFARARVEDIRQRPVALSLDGEIARVCGVGADGESPREGIAVAFDWGGAFRGPRPGVVGLSFC